MTISRSMDNRNKEFEHENVISLKHFPPKLRKLAKYMLENEEIKTVSQACRDLNLNIKSIFTMIHRTRQNGNDLLNPPPCFMRDILSSAVASTILPLLIIQTPPSFNVFECRVIPRLSPTMIIFTYVYKILGSRKRNPKPI